MSWQQRWQSVLVLTGWTADPGSPVPGRPSRLVRAARLLAWLVVGVLAGYVTNLVWH